MSIGGVPNGGVPLGPQQVQVHSFQVLPVAAVEVHPSGLGFPRCDVAVRVVDVPHGVAWMVPMSRQFAGRLAEQLLAAVAALDPDDV